jgi:hypothetical protein
MWSELHHDATDLRDRTLNTTGQWELLKAPDVEPNLTSQGSANAREEHSKSGEYVRSIVFGMCRGFGWPAIQAPYSKTRQHETFRINFIEWSLSRQLLLRSRLAHSYHNKSMWGASFTQPQALGITHSG